MFRRYGCRLTTRSSLVSNLIKQPRGDDIAPIRFVCQLKSSYVIALVLDSMVVI
jgi:hypothetical protein